MTMATATAPGSMPVSVPSGSQIAVKLTMVLGGVVFLLMMLFGLVMRLEQSGLLGIGPELFYQIMTAHGVGMVGTAGMTGAAIMWYFLSRHVTLVTGVFWFTLGLFLLGVVFILGSIFLGGFAAAWTFLFPLPAKSGGAWPTEAAAAYLVGLVCVGVGFLVFYLETGRQIIARYGGLGNAMALPLLFTGKQDDVPPPAVVASAAVTVFNGLGIVCGAAVLVICLINLFIPAFAIDALLVKNMIFFFGHVFINAAIYMAVIGVYEVIPEYTGRPWKTSRVFAGAWLAILFMVMAVYPHHLLQDVAMPGWALIMGQVLSYLSGIPVLAVTAFTLLLLLYRSGIKWDLASALFTLGVFGWSAGSAPAIIDGVISVNKVMHNTLWVPGHFHFYLLLGQVAMAFGFMAWLTKKETGETLGGLSLAAFWGYVLGGLGFIIVFLFAGAAGVPRRWAEHLPEWVLQDYIGSLFAVLVILAVLVFVLQYTVRVISPSKG